MDRFGHYTNCLSNFLLHALCMPHEELIISVQSWASEPLAAAERGERGCSCGDIAAVAERRTPASLPLLLRLLVASHASQPLPPN